MKMAVGTGWDAFDTFTREDWLNEHYLWRLQYLPQQHWYMHPAGYILRVGCAKAEEGLKTTPNSECALNALAIDNPLEYARLYLDGTMQMCVA